MGSADFYDIKVNPKFTSNRDTEILRKNPCFIYTVCQDVSVCLSDLIALNVFKLLGRINTLISVNGTVDNLLQMSVPICSLTIKSERKTSSEF